VERNLFGQEHMVSREILRSFVHREREKRRPRWAPARRAASLDTARPGHETEPQQILRRPDIKD
jgi:hypothetical protein